MTSLYYKIDLNEEYKREGWHILLPRTGYSFASYTVANSMLDCSFVYDMAMCLNAHSVDGITSYHWKECNMVPESENMDERVDYEAPKIIEALNCRSVLIVNPHRRLHTRRESL